MAEPKTNETGRAAEASERAQTAAPSERASPPRNGGAEPFHAEAAAGGVRVRRKRRYLIAGRPAIGSPGADAIHETLGRMEDIETLRRLKPKGFKGLGHAHLGAREVIVARMDDERALTLKQSAAGRVVIEPDARLTTGESQLAAPAALGRSTPVPRRRQTITLRVVGENDQPLAGAGVTVFGHGGFACQGLTDAQGKAKVEMFDAEADLEDVPAVLVSPAADYWDCFLERPNLDAAGTTVVKLHRLTPDKAPTERTAKDRRASWGREAMHIDGAHLTGAGVKIALIDTGCDSGHPALRHVKQGVDLSVEGGKGDWTTDEIGQGTHCAGIICGAAAGGAAGIAPGAEVHVFKLAPGGRLSDLIEALDQCIERHIDIVHLGVGTDQVSELAAHKVAEARLGGVACITGSGDDGGPVRFLATVPGMMCVSAIGRLGEFPRDSAHALTAGLVGPGGLFAASFSGRGPQVDVCAPGVAVISAAPGGGLMARDGGATAAAHVAGLAALILAHHPLFRGVSRGEARVRALFDLIRASASVPVFDPGRVGAGLPDLRRVPGLSEVGAAAGFGDPTVSAGALNAQFGAQLEAMALIQMQMRAAGLI